MKFLMAGASAGFLFGLALIALGGREYRNHLSDIFGTYSFDDSVLYWALVLPAIAGAVIGWVFRHR